MVSRIIPPLRHFSKLILTYLIIGGTANLCKASISAENAIILVNANSPTSRYIAKLYQEYYPEVTDSQILYLSGMTDCSGPVSSAADEIITRQEYNAKIAEPLRDYLLSPLHPQRLENAEVLITTAGLPYRIADTTDEAIPDQSQYQRIVYPAGSNPYKVSNDMTQVNAASVESELTCLWYCDYEETDSFGISNRVVNPYQGCRSGFDNFSRSAPSNKSMNWVRIRDYGATPLTEGSFASSDWFGIFDTGTSNRSFGPGDIYLTCRLDGPKKQGQSAIFAVREMLERAHRATSTGINPMQCVVLIDDVSQNGQTISNLNNNRAYNLDNNIAYWLYNTNNQIPDAPASRPADIRDDYGELFFQLTNNETNPELISVALSPAAGNIGIWLDRRSGTITSGAELDLISATYPGRTSIQSIIAWTCFGANGDEGRSPSYIYDMEGPGGAISNGAVFTSIESFNASTMFSDLATRPVKQGKIIDFIAIGGTAAVGHSFEPVADATIDNEFLFYNLLADGDSNGQADMSFVEAAFTSIPYLSWSEIVIGDPFMTIKYDSQAACDAWRPLIGDTDQNEILDILDLINLKRAMGGKFLGNSAEFNLYNDACDLDRNGVINVFDVLELKRRMR